MYYTAWLPSNGLVHLHLLSTCKSICCYLYYVMVGVKEIIQTQRVNRGQHTSDHFYLLLTPTPPLSPFLWLAPQKHLLWVFNRALVLFGDTWILASCWEVNLSLLVLLVALRNGFTTNAEVLGQWETICSCWRDIWESWKDSNRVRGRSFGFEARHWPPTPTTGYDFTTRNQIAQSRLVKWIWRIAIKKESVRLQ